MKRETRHVKYHFIVLYNVSSESWCLGDCRILQITSKQKSFSDYFHGACKKTKLEKKANETGDATYRGKLVSFADRKLLSR